MATFPGTRILLPAIATRTDCGREVRAELRVETRKTHAGKLTTDAAVWWTPVGPDGMASHQWQPFGEPLDSDFRRELACNKVRCTQKSIDAQHAAALADWRDELMTAAAEHCAAQDKRNASEAA